MGNTKVDLKQLEEFRDRVQKAADEEQQRAFMEACAKELAARLLAKVIKRTPVGDYSGEAYECKGKDMNFTHRRIYCCRAGRCFLLGIHDSYEAVRESWGGKMTEVERMTVELLEEMDDMSPEDIENFRREWFEKLEPEQIRNEKVDDYVNAVCDVAISRAKKRLEVA